MNQYIILNASQIDHKLKRIAHQIIEDNIHENEIILAGIVDNGYQMALKLECILRQNAPFKTTLLKVSINRQSTSLDAICDQDVAICSNKVVILVDDVLNSGRTLAYGFGVFLNIPLKKLRTAVLINRSHRSFPITVDFSGMDLSTTLKEHVEVVLEANKEAVYLT